MCLTFIHERLFYVVSKLTFRTSSIYEITQWPIVVKLFSRFTLNAFFRYYKNQPLN